MTVLSAPAARSVALWHSPDFLKLWAGETISLFGSQVTLLALPLTAVLLLGAGPFEMGLLTAAGYLPFLLIGLMAGVWVDLLEGLQTIVGDPVLRAIAACTATLNLFGYVAQTVFVLFLVRELGVEPAQAGLVMMALGPGALVGAILAARLAARIGVGWTICAVPALSIVPAVMIALAAGPPSVALPMLVLALFLQGLLGTIYNVTQVSLRQRLVPDRLQGRMNATMRFVVWGTIPIGALAGGMLGEAIGLRPTLAIGVVGCMLATLLVTLSPVRSVRDQ